MVARQCSLIWHVVGAAKVAMESPYETRRGEPSLRAMQRLMSLGRVSAFTAAVLWQTCSGQRSSCSRHFKGKAGR